MKHFFFIALSLFSLSVGATDITTVIQQKQQAIHQAISTEIPLWKWRQGPAEDAIRPDFDDSQWKTVTTGYRWYPENSYCCFRTRLIIPEHINGVSVSGTAVYLLAGVDNKAIAYVNGEKRGEFEWDRGKILITEKARPGDIYIIVLDCYNGPGFGRLYKAQLVTDKTIPLLDSLNTLLTGCDAALSQTFSTGYDTTYWQNHVQDALAAIDMDAWYSENFKKFLDSIQEGEKILLSGKQDLSALLSETQGNVQSLWKTIASDRERGKQDAYTTLRARVAESFLQYVRDDAASPDIRIQIRAIRNARCIAHLVKQASPEQEDRFNFPRYHTAPFSIHDGAFWQDNRPLFFCGVGHFSQVRKDVPILKQYGFNIIQIEMGPSTGLPAPGVIDWDAIQHSVIDVLDNAAQHDIAVCLLVSPHYFPQWALEQYPELKQCGYGFLKNCIDAPEALAIYKTWLRALMGRIAHHPALQSICLSNEPQYRGTCSYSLKGFHAWLKQTHGTIHHLNKCWGTHYRRFSDIAIPKDKTSYGHFFDWCRYNQDRLLQFHEFERDIIHEYNPGLPVHAKVMPHAFDEPYRFQNGINHEKFTLLGQISGNDGWQNYVGNQEGPYNQDWVTNLINYTLQHSIAPDHPVMNTEDHIIPDGEKRFIPEGQIRTAFWTQALFYQGGETTWVWERNQKGDLAENILTRANCVYAKGRIALDIQRLAPQVYALQHVPAKAAFLYAYSSLLPSDNYVKEARAAFEGATFTGVPWEFVTETQALHGKLKEYRLIVLTRAKYLPVKVVEALNHYLAEGGTVITVGSCATCDPYKHPLKKHLKACGKGHLIVYPEPLTPAAYRDILARELTQLGIGPELDITGTHEEPVWGIHIRIARDKDGFLVSLVNFLRESQSIRLKIPAPVKSITNLFTGEHVSFPLSLPTLTPILLHIQIEQP